MYGWLLRDKGFVIVLVRWSAAAMYSASRVAEEEVLRAMMNIRLENGSHSIDRTRTRFGFTGIPLFVLSVSSPSPHIALTIPSTCARSDQAAETRGL